MIKYWMLLIGLLISSSAQAKTLIEVVKEAQPKVVTIEVTGIRSSSVDYSTWSTKINVPVEYVGSGAIIKKDGYILTCDHLFMNELRNQEIFVLDFKHKKYKAILLDEDKKHDLALLKIFPVADLPYFKFGKDVKRGQQVLSFGSPLQIDRTVSVGYIENIGLTDRHLVMHSASINPGNSGGPLTDNEGNIVGVNVLVLMADMFSRAEGMNVAVPLSSILRFLK